MMADQPKPHAVRASRQKLFSPKLAQHCQQHAVQLRHKLEHLIAMHSYVHTSCAHADYPHEQSNPLPEAMHHASYAT